jgi:hypothetical protein
MDWRGTADRLSAPSHPLFLILDSLIVSAFPETCEKFGRRRFSPLWRGGRGSVSAHDFHHRCDGHAKSLTLILNTDGSCGCQTGSLGP